MISRSLLDIKKGEARSLPFLALLLLRGGGRGRIGERYRSDLEDGTEWGESIAINIGRSVGVQYLTETGPEKGNCTEYRRARLQGPWWISPMRTELASC